MGFQMGYSKDQLSGASPVPAGPYTLQFKQFRPKASKDKESWSLNAELEIVGNAEYDGRKVFASLNSKAPWIQQDFLHAAGLDWEVVQDSNVGTEKECKTLPGIFENADTDPEHPENWKYLGPLTNKTMQVEVAETEYQGKKRNEIRQYICAVPGCTEKHSTNLIK